jgi:hypothetical protein
MERPAGGQGGAPRPHGLPPLPPLLAHHGSFSSGPTSSSDIINAAAPRPCYHSSAEEPRFASSLPEPADRSLVFSSSAQPPVKKQVQIQFSYSNSSSVLSNGKIIQNNSVGWCVDVIEENWYVSQSVSSIPSANQLPDTTSQLESDVLINIWT